MSRISRYQNSINKFIKEKSILKNISNKSSKIINPLLNDCDYYASVLLLTILSNRAKHNNMNNVHGYHVSAVVEYLILFCKLFDNKHKYKEMYNENKYLFPFMEIMTHFTTCLSMNIETVQNVLTKEKDKNVLKMFHNLIKTFDTKINNIINYDSEISYNNPMKRTDVINYKETDNRTIKDKINKMRVANKNDLYKHIESKYGSACQLALVLGWVLGNGDDKSVSILERMGINFGYLVKISFDFENIDFDLNNSDDITNNLLINFGIQEIFELFDTNKQQFIEGCMKLNIYTNTVKEIIDLIEKKVDLVINSSSIDLRSTFSSH
jgi:hypothetical protein